MSAMSDLIFAILEPRAPARPRAERLSKLRSSVVFCSSSLSRGVSTLCTTDDPLDADDVRLAVGVEKLGILGVENKLPIRNLLMFCSGLNGWWNIEVLFL